EKHQQGTLTPAEAHELIEGFIRLARNAAWWKHEHTHATYSPNAESEQEAVAYAALVEAVRKGRDIRKLVNSELGKEDDQTHARESRFDLLDGCPEPVRDAALARPDPDKLIAAEDRAELREKVRAVSNGNGKKVALLWLLYRNFDDRNFTQRRAAELLNVPESTLSDWLRAIVKCWEEQYGPIPERIKHKPEKRTRKRCDRVKRLLDELWQPGPVEADYLFWLFQRDYPKDKKTTRTNFDQRVKRHRPHAKLVLV